MGTRRIVILGGGFGGVYTAMHLEKRLRRRPDVSITLVSRNNYFLMTPLLFEAGSGVLEPRHAVNPIRNMLHRTEFVEAKVESIDLETKTVHGLLVLREPVDIEYDDLVLALGGITNTHIISGADDALTFKTLADAIQVRNRTIQLFEQAAVEKDPTRRRALLSFVVIGGGFVGVELMGELTVFVRELAKKYPKVSEDDVSFELIEGAGRIAPEFDEKLADYAAAILKDRGVNIRVNTKVQRLSPGEVHLPSEVVLHTQTAIVATGVTPSPLLKDLDLEKDRRGAVMVDATMRSKSRPEVWALGDCASIPSPSGKPYPALAQHALREARQLAKNLAAVIDGGTPEPFIYNTAGNLAALGRRRGVGKIYGVPLKGFVAWWVWRTYYLMRMPGWSRRIRLIIDWTVQLFFGNDIVQLDLGPVDDTTKPAPVEKSAPIEV